MILLLLNDGKTQAEIAEFISCSLKKVSIWCGRGEADNLETLKDKRMQGNYQKVTEEYVNLLLETIEKNPEKLGLHKALTSMDSLIIRSLVVRQSLGC